MNNRNYHTARTVPKSNIKIEERGKLGTPNTQIHGRLPSLLGTGTSMNT